MWMCMAASNVGNLYLLINKNVYTDILKIPLKESTEKTNFVCYYYPKVIKTPAQSLDRNVIEQFQKKT